MPNPDLDQARKAYEIIRRCPGIHATALSVKLGIGYSAALSTLSTMANNGMLVSEDWCGGLHVFDIRPVKNG